MDGGGLISPALGLVPLCGLTGPLRAQKAAPLARIKQILTGVFFCDTKGGPVHHSLKRANHEVIGCHWCGDGEEADMFLCKLDNV